MGWMGIDIVLYRWPQPRTLPVLYGRSSESSHLNAVDGLIVHRFEVIAGLSGLVRDFALPVAAKGKTTESEK